MSPYRLLCLLILVAGLGGCTLAGTTIRFDLPSRKVPATSHGLQVFLSPFEDQRPNPDRIGNKRGGFGNKLGPLVVEQDVPSAMREAVASGLEVQGYRLVRQPEDARVILTGVVLECSAELRRMYLSNYGVGRVATRITVRSASNQSALVQRHLVGDAKETQPLFSSWDDTVGGALTKAFAHLAQAVAEDEAIRRAIKRASRDE